MTKRAFIFGGLAALLSTGCVGYDASEEFVVRSAALENMTNRIFGAAIGYNWGEADLVMVDEAGVSHSWPVQLDASVMVYAGFSWEQDTLERCEFDFEGADGPVLTTDLLDTYTGLGGTATAVYGFRGMRYANDYGVTVAPLMITAGVDIGGPISFLTISLDD